MLRLGATPVPRRSSGTWATPARDRLARVAAAQRRPSTRTAAGRRGRIPAIVSASSRWPLPATPATPTISPRAHRERHAVHRRHAAVAVGAQSRRPRARRSPSGAAALDRRVPSRPRARPSARPARAASRRPPRRSRPTCPPRSTVTRSATAFTSCSLCEMKITVRPSAAIVRSVSKSASASCGVSTAVGSSRIRIARLAVERLEDLDALLLADRELPDPRARVDREPVALARARRPAARSRAGARNERPIVAMVAEHDVLGDRERRHEPEVLVHHADPRVDRVARRAGTRPARRRARSRPRPAGRGR